MASVHRRPCACDDCASVRQTGDYGAAWDHCPACTSRLVFSPPPRRYRGTALLCDAHKSATAGAVDGGEGSQHVGVPAIPILRTDDLTHLLPASAQTFARGLDMEDARVPDRRLMSLFLGSANETGVIVAVPADDYKLAMSIAEPTLMMPGGRTVARRSGVTVYSVIRFVCSASYDVDARAHGRARQQGHHDEVHVFFFFFFFFFGKGRRSACLSVSVIGSSACPPWWQRETQHMVSCFFFFI